MNKCVCNQFRKDVQKRHTWPKFVISVGLAFNCSVATRHVEVTLLNEVEFRSLKTAEKDVWAEVLGKKFYGLAKSVTEIC